MPLVSVVLIFLNEERFLEEAVQSVREQEAVDWELVLVDDGSTDGSTMIARALAAADARIRYVDHPGHKNLGMSASRNLGAALATAPYVAFLDGDDVWVPRKLAEQVELLERMPDVAMVCGALLYWHSWDEAATEADRVVLTGGQADTRVDPPELALALYPLGEGAGAGVDVLVRRNSFEAVGGFEVCFRGLYEDRAFLTKIFLRYPVYISSQPWLLYRQHEDSHCAQANRSRSEYWRLRGIFLDWMHTYVEEQHFSDARISTALRRGRRKVRLRKLQVWLYGAVRPALGLLPIELGRRLQNHRLDPIR